MSEQGSPEWIAERLGKVTASRIADMLAKTKTGWGASRSNYAAQLVAERLTGELGEAYQNAAMKWGIDTEPQARAAYDWAQDVTVEQVGFIPHPTISMAGASPDGHVGEHGSVEIKCPNTATHIETLLSGKVAEKYVLQMQFQLACSGRQWCDFVSFDPRMPESMRLFTHRVIRSGIRIQEIEAEARTFLSEIDATVAALEKQYGKRLAA